MGTIDIWDDPNYVFEYDPTSKSCLRWKKHKRHPSLIGTECGTKTVRGEWAVQFRGMPRLVHRIIWEMFNGKPSDIDIIRPCNGDLGDLRIENLRCVTKRTNARNVKLGSRNRTGILGVSNRDTLWIAHWREGGRTHYESFSILKYGEEEAKRLAIECRNANIARLNELYGEESYTEHHGL